jgi:hypothetical protein
MARSVSGVEAYPQTQLQTSPVISVVMLNCLQHSRHSFPLEVARLRQSFGFGLQLAKMTPMVSKTEMKRRRIGPLSISMN